MCPDYLGQMSQVCPRPLKVRILSRYDVQKSLSTSCIAMSSILLYTLPVLANPNVISINWNVPNGLINTVHDWFHHID